MSATNSIPKLGDGVTGTYVSAEPPAHWFAITPNNSADLAYVTRGIVVGVAGDVKVDTVGGESAVVIPMVAGYNPGQFTKIYASGTTATGLVGYY